MLGLKTTPSTAIAPLLAELDPEVKAEAERKAEALAERLRGAGETDAARYRDSLDGLGVPWPSTVSAAQIAAQYLPLFGSRETSDRDMEVRGDDWRQTGASLERQAHDLAARIVNEHPHFTHQAIEPLRRYLTLKAEAPCYAAAIPGLRDSLARLRDRWNRTKPIASRNCTIYLNERVTTLQAVLIEAVQRVDEATRTRDQLVASIHGMARAFESRYGITVKPVVVDRERWTIVPAKE